MLSPYAFICNLLVATNCQTGYSVFIHNNAARGNSQQTSIRETAFNYRCVVSLNMATLSLLPRHAHKGTLSTASVPNCQLMSVTLFYLPRRSCCSSLQGTPRNWCFKTNSSLRGKGPTTAEVWVSSCSISQSKAGLKRRTSLPQRWLRAHGGCSCVFFCQCTQASHTSAGHTRVLSHTHLSFCKDLV